MSRRFASWALSAFIFATVAAGCADQPTDPIASGSAAPSMAPLYGVGAGRAIPDRYIVVFRKDVKNARGLARQLALGHRGSVELDYGHALKGFSIRLPASAVRALSRNPNIAFIEQDRYVEVTGAQTNAPWSLDRVDQRAQPFDGTYNFTATGAGVRVYIIDTGIRTSHTEFSGRASVGFDIFGGNGQDCNGHGTHVAGIVGGTTSGIAKSVQLVSVRVLGCNGSGTLSGIAAGIDWVTSNHTKPAVANLSMTAGTTPSFVLDEAVRNSIAAGVTYTIAAGNSNLDACTTSPSRVSGALTVGATSSADARSYYSSWGSCLDLFAPGDGITSASNANNTGFRLKSGTSMAAPHVAGVAALYLQSAPTATPAQVAAAVTSTATAGKVTDLGEGSPNRLLYSLLTVEEASPPPPAPPPAPCTNCTLYTGSLSDGSWAWQPNGGSYYSYAGTHSGWLQGPTSANFQLFLYMWLNNAWTVVQSSQGATSTEQITYTGTAGYYTWQVYSAGGTGSYEFWLRKP